MASVSTLVVTLEWQFGQVKCWGSGPRETACMMTTFGVACGMFGGAPAIVREKLS